MTNLSRSMYLNSIPRPASAAVIGASGGIGSAIVKLLSGGNFDVVHAFSRAGNSLVLPNVRTAKLDLEDEASIAAAAANISNGAPVRVIFVATGLLHDDMLEPEKTFRSLNGEKLARSFRINAVGPALIAKHMCQCFQDQARASLPPCQPGSEASRITSAEAGTAIVPQKQL